jgi:hypothetical protein
MFAVTSPVDRIETSPIAAKSPGTTIYKVRPNRFAFSLFDFIVNVAEVELFEDCMWRTVHVSFQIIERWQCVGVFV